MEVEVEMEVVVIGGGAHRGGSGYEGGDDGGGGSGGGLVKMEVVLVKMEVEIGLFKNLMVSVLGFSDISDWFLVFRIRRFLLE